MAADKEQAALRARLDGLLKRPENQTCADCRGRMPRWASTNLGIFVCTSCSGIHRGLGVHISKVRSVALDKWTPELVDGMVGNAQANAFWEGGNPPGQYDRPSEGDMQRLNQFIRAKYEGQVYADKSRQPPRLSAGAPVSAPVAASQSQPPPRLSAGAPVAAAASQPPPLPRKPLPPAPGAVAGAADLLSGLQVSSQAHKSRTTADALDELAGFVVQAPTVHASASCPVLPNEAQNWLSEAYGGGYQSGYQSGAVRSGGYVQQPQAQQPQSFRASGVGPGAFSFAPPPGPGRPVMRPPGPL